MLPSPGADSPVKRAWTQNLLPRSPKAALEPYSNTALARRAIEQKVTLESKFRQP